MNGDRFSVEASLSLARGMDYYTCTVFEIYMEGFEFIKSVWGPACCRPEWSDAEIRHCIDRHLTAG